MLSFKIILPLIILTFSLSSCFNSHSKKSTLLNTHSIFYARKIQQQSELQIDFIPTTSVGYYRMQVKPILFNPAPDSLMFKVIISTNPRYQHEGANEQIWNPQNSNDQIEWIVFESHNFQASQDKFYYPIEIWLVPISNDSKYKQFQTQTATHLPTNQDIKDQLFKVKSNLDQFKNLKLFY